MPLPDDVIDHRTTEEQLQLYRQIIAHATDGIAVIGPDGVYLEQNEAHRRLLGYSDDELSGKTPAVHLGETRFAKMREHLKRHGNWKGEIVSRCRDGREILVEQSTFVVRDAAGMPQCYVAIKRDATERKRAEQAVRNQARTLETLNRVASKLAGELNLETAVQMVTDAGTELSGAEFGAFFYNVQNDTGESYTLYALSGAPRSAFDRFPMPRNTSIFGPTFRGEGLLRLDDVTLDPRFGQNPPYHGLPEGHLPVRSYLAVPVVSRSGDVLGGLFFGHSSPGVFSTEIEPLISGLAAQAAIAIDNARLYQAAQQEIAERKQIEESLRESEDRMLFTLDAAHVGTWDWQVATGEVRWSENMEALHGLEAGTFDGTFQGFLNDVHPDQREHVQQAIAEAFENGGRYAVEYRLANERNGPRWVEGKGRVIYDDDGRPVRMAGICTDITERRRAEEIRHQIAAIVESSNDAIIGKTLDGTITSWNPGAQRMFGYTAEEAIGRPITLIVPAERLDEIPQLYNDVRLGQRLENLETVRLSKDGRRIQISLSVSPIRDNENRIIGVSGIERDISDRKAAEERLRRLNEELRLSNQEMEQFVYTVSHDLKSPLVTISGFVGLLKEDVAAGRMDDVLDSVDRLERAAARMNELINDLLQLSRIGRLVHHAEPVDVTALVHEVVDYLHPRLSETGAAVEIQAGMPRVLADRVRLSEVFDNLLTNAIKYGCVGLEPRITIGAETTVDEVRFFVRDNGPGISAEYHERIFGLFQRLDSREEGTGVGLAIVARIVQVLGGRVWVESAAGHGATFWFALPSTAVVAETELPA